MDEKLVYIVLLNYKGYEDTSACIDSLQNIDYPDYKIIVVDNQSCDGSYERLMKEYPDCVFLLAQENNGFSAGNNLGIHYALSHGADYVLMLNNDTTVEPNFLSIMVASADEDTVVTPSIYYYDDPHDIWYADGRINYNRCTVSNGTDKESKFCDYASGCCLLMSRKVLETVGDWAEEFFMYYEDMDYSLRIGKHGYRIFYAAKAIIYHKAGRSAGKNSKLSIYYNVRNRFYIMRAFDFGWKAWVYSVATRLIRGITGIVFRTPEQITFLALKDFITGKTGKRSVL